MNENLINKPILKAIIFALVPMILMAIIGIIIYSLQIEPYTNFLFLLIHAFFVSISIIIGLIIIKKLKWNITYIGLKNIEKNMPKDVFYYLLLFIIIIILPLFTGFKENENGINKIIFIIFLVLHYLVVGLHEEFYFRGIIMSLFKDNLKKAIIISSITFTLIHLINVLSVILNLEKELIPSDILSALLGFLLSSLPILVLTFFIGVVFAEIVVLTKSIIPVILFHWIINFINNITNMSFLIGMLQTISLIILAIVLWKKILKKSPNCT
jgi:membrane protease YdiL (CAAX protease family)